LPGDTATHAFLWQNGTTTDLGTLPGDTSSFAYAINDTGQVVGQSCDQAGNCRAFLWHNGTMTDLNTLVAPDGSLALLSAEDINSQGEIVGQALDQSTGYELAFSATPCSSLNAGEASCTDPAQTGIATQGLKPARPTMLGSSLTRGIAPAASLVGR
jgi:probable HAF family extracellular repeat protein